MLDFRMLGTVEVLAGDQSLALGAPKQRAVLAVLLLEAGQVVATDRLIELVWGEDAPRTAAHSVQIYVSELRRTLGGEIDEPVIVTRSPGYVLTVDPGAIDAFRFERLVGAGLQARRAGDLDTATANLREALAMWAPPLADFTYEEFAQAAIRRLTSLRFDAIEELASIELDRGRPRDALTSLSEAREAEPLRESTRAVEMLALYRAGRHVEALRSYEQFRTRLGEELGLEPSPTIRRLQERILLHDPTLTPPSIEAGGETPVERRNPYKGLRPFGEEDVGDFFGRTALVDQLVAAIAERRLVAVVGPSGSGKSSAVMAGLVPALRDGALPGSERWEVVRMVPGRRPAEELDFALRATTPGAEVLLVIDQLEELYSLVADDEQRRFLRELAATVERPESRIRIVLTLRADLYDRPLLDPEFGPVFSAGVVNVHAMTRSELEAAVVGPARRVGIEVSPTLVASLIADTASQPGGLPLLQYALTELFERTGGSDLAAADYEALGGLHELVARSAEDAYVTLTEEQQRVALQLFLRLVASGERHQLTKRRTPVSELTALGLDPVTLSEVLEVFAGRRLLTFDHDTHAAGPTVELAHEALLRAWPRLATWLEEHAADLTRHAALATAVDDWEAAGRDEDYVFSGGRLAEFEQWAERTSIDLTDGEHEFLVAGDRRRAASQAVEDVRSQQQRHLEHRARRRLVGMLAAVAVLAAAITYGVLAWPADDPPDAVLLAGEPALFRSMLADGFAEAEAELGISQELIAPAAGTPTAAEVEAAAADGAGLVVVMTGDCAAVVDDVAPDHPDAGFVVFDCPGEIANVAYVTFAAEQGSFLAGAAAALKSETGHVGFIGAVDMQLLWEFQAGFEAGARAVDPDVVIDARYLTVPPDMTGFDMQVGAFQVAEEFYRGGADVIYAAAGGSVIGVVDAAIQLSDELDRHLWMIGVDGDLFLGLTDERSRAHILTSMLKRFDRAVFTMLEEHHGDAFEPGLRRFDLSTGAVDLALSGGYIDDIQPQLDELRASIVSGDVEVPTIPPGREDEAEAADP